MPFTRQEAFRKLVALNPAPIFLQSYEGKQLPENLDIYFGPPEEFFISPESQELYTQGRLVPILDDGNFGVVTFCDSDARILVQMDVESPEDKTIFRSWQQYLASLMIRFADSIENIGRIRRMAEIIQFTHIKEFFEYLEQPFHELPADKWMEARRRFPMVIKE